MAACLFMEFSCQFVTRDTRYLTALLEHSIFALPITDSEMIPTVLLINYAGIFDECLSKAAGSCDCSISVSTILSTK